MLPFTVSGLTATRVPVRAHGAFPIVGPFSRRTLFLFHLTSDQLRLCYSSSFAARVYSSPPGLRVLPSFGDSPPGAWVLPHRTLLRLALFAAPCWECLIWQTLRPGAIRDLLPRRRATAAWGEARQASPPVPSCSRAGDFVSRPTAAPSGGLKALSSFRPWLSGHANVGMCVTDGVVGLPRRLRPPWAPT